MALIVIGLACCDDDAPRPPSVGGGDPAALAEAIGKDAEALQLALDPPAKAGDLRADIETFADIESCARAHAALDPIVADAVDAIGYDELVHDACRVLDAAKHRDVRRCEPIVVQALRTRCVTTVAIVSEKPDACPWVRQAHAEEGRDPLCLAGASRDAALCRATDQPKRCEAWILGDTAACAKLADRAVRARCARDATRYKPLFEGAARPSNKAKQSSASLEPIDASGAKSGDAIRMTHAVAHGVVLVRSLGRWRVRIGEPGQAGERLGRSPGTSDVAVELELDPEAKTASVTQADVHANGDTLSFAVPRRADVKSLDIDPERGKRLGVDLVFAAGRSAAERRFRLRIDTFVRDTVTGGLATRP